MKEHRPRTRAEGMRGDEETSWSSSIVETMRPSRPGRLGQGPPNCRLQPSKSRLNSPWQSHPQPHHCCRRNPAGMATGVPREPAPNLAKHRSGTVLQQSSVPKTTLHAPASPCHAEVVEHVYCILPSRLLHRISIHFACCILRFFGWPFAITFSWVPRQMEGEMVCPRSRGERIDVVCLRAPN